MTYKIKEISEELGFFSAHTLRYYEKEGIIPHVKKRDDNGNRLYEQHIYDWLSLVKCLKKSTGMSIKDLKHIARLTFAGDETIVKRLEVLRAHRSKKMEQQLKDTMMYLERIEGKIGYYESLTEKKVSLKAK